MQHCKQSTVKLLNVLLMLKGSKCQIRCVQGLSPRPGGKAIWAFRLGGLAVHHQSVLVGSFVNFLGLVRLQGWLQARCTANPKFLKLKGAQQPGISYITMGTKLHHPDPNQTSCLSLRTKDVSSVNENMWACIIPLESVCSVSGRVDSPEQVDVPMSQASAFNDWGDNCPILALV